MIQFNAILVVTLLFSGVTSGANWDYPNSVGQSGKFTVNEKVIATSHSKQSTDSFREVAAWYAERTNLKAIPKHIDDYRDRDTADPDLRTGSLDNTANSFDKQTVSTAVYAFTPQHMHVTIVMIDDTGDTVSLSIAGSDNSTTINIVRRVKDRSSQLTR